MFSSLAYCTCSPLAHGFLHEEDLNKKSLTCHFSLDMFYLCQNWSEVCSLSFLTCRVNSFIAVAYFEHVPHLARLQQKEESCDGRRVADWAVEISYVIRKNWSIFQVVGEFCLCFFSPYRGRSLLQLLQSSGLRVKRQVFPDSAMMTKLVLILQHFWRHDVIVVNIRKIQKRIVKVRSVNDEVDLVIARTILLSSRIRKKLRKGKHVSLKSLKKLTWVTCSWSSRESMIIWLIVRCRRRVRYVIFDLSESESNFQITSWMRTVLDLSVKRY